MFHSDYLAYRTLVEEYEDKFIEIAEEFTQRTMGKSYYNYRVISGDDDGCFIALENDGYGPTESIHIPTSALSRKGFEEWLQTTPLVKYKAHFAALAEFLKKYDRFPAVDINGEDEEGIFIMAYEGYDPESGINYFISHDMTRIESIYDYIQRRDAKK